MADVETIGRLAYAAYGELTDHKNYQGLPMPTWDDLPENIRAAWRGVADAVAMFVETR